MNRGRRELLRARQTLMLSACLVFASAHPLLAQQGCTKDMRVEGTITDPAGAVIPGAKVQTTAGEQTMTDAAGHYLFPCVPARAVTITAQAAGFEAAKGIATANSGGVARVNLQLAMAAVQTNVEVNANPQGVDNPNAGDTTVLNTTEVQRMADDPDDFLRELQVLASEAGGDPTSAVILVDGFQNASALPPKASIASIRIAPDLFSAKYEWPPFSGGVIEITTKPGGSAFHGDFFYTDSEGSFNATDPFSTIATPAGKRRYGFDFSGPIRTNKSSFSLSLEKRDINEFNVVNALTLDANDSVTPLNQTVPAPQRLWIASARSDWQLTQKDEAALSFAANANNLGNQGIGGAILEDAGYSSLAGEYDLRFSNTYAANANLLQETHVGFTWKRTEQDPLSDAPSLEVAGYFTGGGSTAGGLNDRERDLEIDHDLTLTRGRQTFDFGAQSLGIFLHDYDPSLFNGAFVFGGGSAPVLDANNYPTGETTTISAIEQYRRSLLNLPGGSPTTYQLTRGEPLVSLLQWRLGLYAQDDVKFTPQFTLSTGLRYMFQTSPGTFANFNPRVGIAWALDKKQTWLFHTRVGIFAHSIEPSYATDAYRLNGIRQQQETVYSPSFSSPLTSVPGSIQVSTVNQFPRTFVQPETLTIYVNLEHEFAHHWHFRGNYYRGQDWNIIRIVNINAPMVASSIGSAPDPTAALLAPRPIAPNENIVQYQNSGHLRGHLYSVTLDQHSYKRFGLSTRYAHFDFDTDVPASQMPQSSYSDAGEAAPVFWESRNGATFVGNLILPWKLEAMTQLDAWQGHPFTIVTGTDNNGDGNFNDRPSYAAAPGPGVYSTRYGLMTTNTVNGNVPANVATNPGTIHLDMNLSRAFTLNPRDKDHPRTLTFNARSANLLNHTNVTAVGTVVSSPTLGQALAADTARRVEVGARFSF